ncbi:hypothetical protein [Pedobacter duraquae]|uniref:Uncharacterized protein n=1 Tax=Pedobacter duraquae TaxID=425511 RepID=A0A4R6IBZ1_9SPHI|nr:hypothetical protein [Pedobacter duraquae]TDO19344.1 hypothetical protein CLV32_4584 [Pedobacter duraquae]
MNKIKKYTIYICFLALFPSQVFSQIHSLKDFTICNQCPKVIFEGQYPLSTIKKHMKVSINNHDLQITEVNYSPGLYTLPTKYGEFVGLNNGEWGGGLYLKPSNGDSIFVNGKIMKTSSRFEQASSFLNKSIEVVPNVTGKAIPIAYGNIYGLASFKEKLIFTSSSENLYEHLGTLSTISFENGVKVTEVFRFNGIPLVMGASDTSVYVATTKGIYIFEEGLKQSFIKVIDLSQSFPNSLVVLKPYLLAIGAVGGYYLVNLKNGQNDFYVLQNLKK